MDVPQITDDAERRKWLVAQPRREGLLTREFASVMDVNPSAIRAAIRRGKLRGVRLRALGKVYAYAATVDAVAEYYGLSEDVVSYLQGLTRVDVTGRFSWVGIPFFDQSGCTEIPTELENQEELDRANDDGVSPTDGDS